MMQQWQQLTDQQKKLAVVLTVVIVLAFVIIVWQLMPKRQTQQAQQMPLEEPGLETMVPQALQPGSEAAPGVSQPGMPLGVPSGPSGMASGATAVSPTEGEAPAPIPPGKLETPPRPGRSDPFADLPTSGKVLPFTPIVLPPTPEPVIIAKTTAGSVGTETFSTQEIASNIPTLQAQSVNLRSYFSPPQPSVTQRELIGWRLAGTITTEGSVGAIIQTPDARTRSVRLGDRITYGGLDLTVKQVEEQRVVLRDQRGDEYVLTRRPSVRVQTLQPYGGMFLPGGFGPSAFGPGGFGPGGFVPGGFGPGGFAPGGFGLGGFGPGSY